MKSERGFGGYRPEQRSADPKEAERSLLSAATKGRAGRWLSMAALALSTEGCATFAGIITGEGQPIHDVKYGPGVDFDSETKSASAHFVVTGEAFEKPNMQMWWTRGEGVFVPKSADIKLPEGAPKLRFLTSEPLPTEPVALIHRRSTDTPATMVERGVFLLSPAIETYGSVHLDWHEGHPTGGDPLADTGDTTLRMTVEDPPTIPEEGPGMSFEDGLIRLGFSHPERLQPGSVLVSAQTAPSHPDQPLFAGAIVFARMPGEDEETSATKSEAKAERVAAAAALLAPFGLHETRIYQFPHRSEPGVIVVLAVMDSPLLSKHVEKKDAVHL